jgi:uncharacterized membrane protein YeaQ/YmgE (transglycosylase-associated protein family)
MLGAIVLLLISGFAFGALARWAVPGPDPMPVWLTIFVGLGGSAIGGGITAAALDVNTDVSRADYFTIELASILISILLVVAYRYFVQKRPILGPEALKEPTRGVGIGRPGRQSMRQAIVKAQLLKGLEDLRANGLLTDEEYREKRARILQPGLPPGEQRSGDEPPES